LVRIDRNQGLDARFSSQLQFLKISKQMSYLWKEIRSEDPLMTRDPLGHFGIGVDRPTVALVAFLAGKAAPAESPPTKVFTKML
jgi:hypothetical protein